MNGADFPANIVAKSGGYYGFGTRLNHSYGLDPAGLRVFTDLRLEVANGDSLYGRGALDLTVTHGLGRLAGALTLSGGSSVGGLPAQRRWYLGGSQTVRGQSPDTAQSGNAFWLTRAEIGANDAAVRPALFADFGWTGDRDRLRRSWTADERCRRGRARSSTGYSASTWRAGSRRGSSGGWTCRWSRNSNAHREAENGLKST